MNVGQHIREIRNARNMTQSDVSSKCGFSASHLSDIENGKTSPTIENLSSISKAMSVNLLQILDLDLCRHINLVLEHIDIHKQKQDFQKSKSKNTHIYPTLVYLDSKIKTKNNPKNQQ